MRITMEAPSGRRVLLAGATGLVGRELLRGLLGDESVQHVIVIGRSAPAQGHPKLHFQAVDFRNLPALPPLQECYIALGTTIKVAGSQQAFRAIDFDAVVNTARAAQAAGATRAGVVSAMGASATSGVFYSRVKGQMEDALAALRFDGLVIARPSMLAGDRPALGQPTRRGEEIALAISGRLGFLIPRNYRSVAAANVARALLATVPVARGRSVLLSGELQRYGEDRRTAAT